MKTKEVISYPLLVQLMEWDVEINKLVIPRHNLASIKDNPETTIQGKYLHCNI